MKVRANGIDVDCELTGEGSGLVLIHGFTDNQNMWFHQVPAFSKRHRVLTYDVRGSGQTRGGEAGYSMGLFARDLCELMRALGIKEACVLGYSMGGRIALEFALSHPEMTTGLIFANSGVGAAPSPEMEERRKMFAEVLKQGDIGTIAELMAEASFSPGFRERNPEAFRRYKEVKMQNDPADYLAIMQAIVGAIDAPVDLGRLGCPVLVLAGEHDSLMEVATAESMKRAIREAGLEILPTGHAAAIEMPAEFNAAVLRFLEKLERVGCSGRRADTDRR